MGDNDIDVATKLGEYNARIGELERKVTVLFSMVNVIRDWKIKQTAILMAGAVAISYLVDFIK